MPINVSEVDQVVRGLVNGRPFNVFSVKDFGAVGDGLADDTSAIRATIDAVETIFLAQGDPVNSRVRASVPMVYFPPGRYKTTGTLNVTCQIRLMGAGYMASAVVAFENFPVFTVNVGTLLKYAPPVFIDLAICGSELPLPGVDPPKPGQHGIQVNFNPAGGGATLAVIRCAIESCGGHGLYFPEEVNTPRIFDSIIQSNRLDGIHFSGKYATAAQIMRNVIRENRRGIYYDGTLALTYETPYLFTGYIVGNLFELNTTGKGRAGSDTRPCRGIEANNVRELVILGNYFERHLNHVWLGRVESPPGVFHSSSYDRVLHNFFAGAETIPGEYPDPDGPVFKPADVVIASSDSFGMWIEGNAIAPHSRPSGTSEENWGPWGPDVEAWPHLAGRQHVIRNDAGAAQTVDLSNIPRFREWYTLDYQLWGVRRGDAGIMLTPLDGDYPTGEYLEISSRITLSDVSGRSALRFYRRASGGGALEVWANDNGKTAQSVARFNGQTRLTSVEGLAVTEGTNARMGTATLGVGGTATVNTDKVTGTSRIFLTGQNESGTSGELTISNLEAGTFTIQSSNTADRRQVAWLIVEPGP